MEAEQIRQPREVGPRIIFLSDKIQIPPDTTRQRNDRDRGVVH